MDFKNKFVHHGKIHLFDLAIIEMYGSESYMTDLGSVKITIVERAIYKSDSRKTTSGEITFIETTGFKFLEIECFLGIFLTVVVGF
jgi:hypothetical protein